MKSYNFEYPSHLTQFIDEAVTEVSKDRHLCDRFFDWITQQSMISGLTVPLTFDAEKVLSEIKLLESYDLFVPYDSGYAVIDQPNRNWQACAIYGVSARQPQNPVDDASEFNAARSTNRWTEAADLMPYFRDWVISQVGSPRRMLVMKLPPGGYVPPHRDLGPLAHPNQFCLPQVNFHVQWPPGSCWYMEDSDHGVHATQEGSVTMHSFYHKHTVINDNLHLNRYFVYGFFDYVPRFKNLVIEAFMQLMTKQIDRA